MGRVLADLAVLHDLAEALAASRDTLADMEDVTRLDATDAGHVDVAAGVGEVADDWDRRRARLITTLATLEAYTAAAAQAFSDVDATVITVAVPGRR